VGAPIQTFGLGKTIKESYAKSIFVAGTPTPTQGSPRIHQLLLHELVEIVSENGDEVLHYYSTKYFYLPIRYINLRQCTGRLKKICSL